MLPQSLDNPTLERGYPSAYSHETKIITLIFRSFFMPLQPRSASMQSPSPEFSFSDSSPPAVDVAVHSNPDLDRHRPGAWSSACKSGAPAYGPWPDRFSLAQPVVELHIHLRQGLLHVLDRATRTVRSNTLQSIPSPRH